MKGIGGWPYPWGKSVPWPDLADRYRVLATDIPATAPVLAVIESVIENGMEGRLTACTSMHDLMVTTEPPTPPPIDVIFVRSVGSRKSQDGQVTIEHTASSGLRERITRPEGEVLPLFWRFVLEKYGLSSDRCR